MSQDDNNPLHSEQWFRVAALRPQLDGQARIERVSYRRQIWHVLTRADGSRSFRLNASAYAFVARCNGKLSMQKLWELLLQDMSEDAPTQGELLQLLAQLHAAALVSFDRRPDFGAQGVVQQLDGFAKNQAPNGLFSFRMPFFRPDGILTWAYPHVRWLFQPWVLVVWALVVLLGAAAAWFNAGMLHAHAQFWMHTPRMLAVAWVCYPVVKSLHELGHGLAIKHHGGEVPECGVNVMMFMPVPYVDASATSAYAGKAQRLLVSGAGIMVELFLATVALFVVLNTQPGWAHDIGLAVFFIGSVSTLLVNGNPLMRFDGYHVLCDAVSLPNLGTRSQRHWLGQLRRWVLRAPPPNPLLPARGEAPWLWLYAPLAWGYRFVVAFSVIGWLAGLSFIIGMAVAAVFTWSIVLKPVGQYLRFLANPMFAHGPQRKVRLRGIGVAAGVLLALLCVPVPFSSVVQGVVWLPEKALLRVQTDGFVRGIHVTDGQVVEPGQPLLTLESPALEAERIKLNARLNGLQAERVQTLRSEPGRSASLEREMASVQAELDRAEEKLALLQVRAQTRGRVVIDHAADLPGRYLKQGALLGHVMTNEPSLVRVAVGQEQAALLHAQTQSVSVRLAELGQSVLPAELVRDANGAVTKLPSAALGDRGGGSIVTDPKDKQGLTAAQTVVLADVRLPLSLGERVGGRAWVRFDHGLAPLAEQGARVLQQMVLQHFNPSE